MQEINTHNHRNAGRRLFLKFSAAGGLGVLVAGETSAKDVADQCGFKLSAFEALSMFTDLLFRIQSDSFSLLTKRMENVAAGCQEQFAKLCQTVEQLTAKLTTGDPANRAQQMKVLAELGCSTATGLASGSNQQGSTALLKALETINNEIASAAEQLLPQGETVLSPEATALLRNILVQVHQSAAIQRSISDARKTVGPSRELIRQGTQEIQEILFTAGTEILLADIGNATEARQARIDAVNSLEQARTKLVAHIDKLKAEQLYLETPTAGFLLLALEGTKEWVNNPASVASVVSFKSGPEALHHAPPIGFNPGQITQVVHDNCPPDGLVRVGRLITAMTPLLFWKRTKAALSGGASPTDDEILAAVRTGLSLLGFTCAPFKDHVPHPEQLAQSLSNMIKAW